MRDGSPGSGAACSGAPAPAAAAPRAARSRAGRLLATLGPDFSLILLFIAAELGLVAAYGASFKWAEGPILISFGIGVLLVAGRLLYGLPAVARGEAGAGPALARSVRALLRDWGPFILVLWMFQSLETYTGVIRPDSVDAALYRLDVWLFGVEPSAWAGRIAHPALTEWFAFAYGLYFILPISVITALSLRGRRDDFREMATAVILLMGAGFVLFLIFPAGPPRYYHPLLAGGFDPPALTSYSGLYELQQGVFDTANPVRTRASFPSLHCGLALLAWLYARRFGDAVFPRRPRLLGWIFAPLVVSLWLSTIYLRHHWVPDCVAGWLLGWAACAAAPALRRRWPVAPARPAAR